MEAVEKDFQDLVTSEEEPTTAVTTDVEDEIIQQILTSEADVEEMVEVEETEDLEEEGILDEDDVEALSDEEDWDDVAETELTAMSEFLGILQEEFPDVNLDNCDIVIHDDGGIEVIDEF